MCEKPPVRWAEYTGVCKKPPIREAEYTGKSSDTETNQKWEIRILGLGNKGKRKLKRSPLKFPQIIHWGKCCRFGGITLKPGTRRSKR